MSNLSGEYQGDTKHFICVLDSKGDILEQRSITNHRESLRRMSQKYPDALIAIEVESHSPWISRFLKSLGHHVLVANVRKVRAIYANMRKSDQLDAMMLARIARMDPKLLHPIEHGTEEQQRDLLPMKLRDTLLRQRANIISSIRFTLKSLGIKLPSPNTACFAKRARTLLQMEHEDVYLSVSPMLEILDLLTLKIQTKYLLLLVVVHYGKLQRNLCLRGAALKGLLSVLPYFYDHFHKPTYGEQAMQSTGVPLLPDP